MRLAIIIAASLAAGPLIAQDAILDAPCKKVVSDIVATADDQGLILAIRGIDGVAETSKNSGFYMGIAHGYIIAKTGGPQGAEWIKRCKSGDDMSFGEVLRTFDQD